MSILTDLHFFFSVGRRSGEALFNARSSHSTPIACQPAVGRAVQTSWIEDARNSRLKAGLALDNRRGECAGLASAIEVGTVSKPLVSTLGEAYKPMTDVDPREQMMIARTRTVEYKMVLDIKTVLNYFDEAAAVIRVA